MISLTDNISYIPATEEPFTADVAFIRTKECIWIYDVGTTDEIAEYINSISEPIKIVISHFHPDHLKNLEKIQCDEIYGGKETVKHIGKGIIVQEEIDFGEVKIGPLPNSHAKGSLYLETGNYIFVGDATYSAFKKDGRFYNVQLLLDEIKFLESRDVEFCVLSHDPIYAVKRTKIITKLKKIYGLRQGNSPEIQILF